MIVRREFLAMTAAGAIAAMARPMSAAPVGTLLYVAALPNKLLVLDEAQEKVVNQVTLPTGVGRGLVLSNDRKKIFINTWPRCGFEVIDRATDKVVNSFKLDLDDNSRRMWLRAFAVDPQDRLIYAVVNTRIKLVDRFEIEMPKFVVIDVAQQKIVKTFDYPKEELHAFSGFGGLKVSPDGKYLYQFRDKILIFDTTDFKLVQKIELAKPVEFGEMETVTVTIGDDPYDKPGMVTAIFNATDPIVHQPVFGLAQINLAQRSFEFTPVGPAINFMTGLKLTPDRKTGYLVAYRDLLGNRHTEFWVFDMTNRKLVKTVEFPGPTQIRFTLSGNGKDIYIYGGAPLMDIYDAATLKLKKTLDLNADMSSFMLVVPPSLTPA
jgi:hypothetical protein